MAAAQVEELTRQLEQFSAQAHHAQAHPGSKAYFVQLHLERLRAELMVFLPHFLDYFLSIFLWNRNVFILMCQARLICLFSSGHSIGIS